MYNINKCSYFTTVKELRTLLADIPDDASVFVGGSDAYLHVSDDNNLISFDYDNLWEAYDEWYPEEDESFWDKQEALIKREHEARLALLNKQMEV